MIKVEKKEQILYKPNVTNIYESESSDVVESSLDE